MTLRGKLPRLDDKVMESVKLPIGDFNRGIIIISSVL